MNRKMLREDAYVLSWDVERFELLDYEEDIYFDDFSQKYGKIYRLEPIEVSASVLYRGDLMTLPLIDYPYPHPQQNLCVMSKRMLAVLQSVKSFGCREIPIEIKDWAMKPERRLPPNADYVGVQLTAYADVFDYEKSVYEKQKYAAAILDAAGEETWFVSNVKEYVFRVPPEGLPPIFRVKENPVALFVSDEARQALKEAKITGVRYESLKGIRHGEVSAETDVSLPLPN